MGTQSNRNPAGRHSQEALDLRSFTLPKIEGDNGLAEVVEADHLVIDSKIVQHLGRQQSSSSVVRKGSTRRPLAQDDCLGSCPTTLDG